MTRSATYGLLKNIASKSFWKTTFRYCINNCVFICYVRYFGSPFLCKCQQGLNCKICRLFNDFSAAEIIQYQVKSDGDYKWDASEGMEGEITKVLFQHSLQETGEKHEKSHSGQLEALLRFGSSKVMVNSRLKFQSCLVYLVTGYLPNAKLEHCSFTSLFRASRNNDRGTSQDLILT